MDINAAFPSKFVKAADLQGQDVSVTIARFAMESVDDDSNSELKPVIYFAGHQRGLVLNKTNAMSIADLYGTETDRWLGQPITLFPTHCAYGAKTVDCVRVRPFAPQPPEPAAQPFGQPQQPAGQLTPQQPPPAPESQQQPQPHPFHRTYPTGSQQANSSMEFNPGSGGQPPNSHGEQHVDSHPQPAQHPQPQSPAGPSPVQF